MRVDCFDERGGVRGETDMSDAGLMYCVGKEESDRMRQGHGLLVENEYVDGSVESRRNENTTSENEAECLPVFFARARFHLLV